jgi:hypothetical protein
MLTNYQKDLIADLNQPRSYGKPIAVWKGRTEILRTSAVLTHLGPLTPDLAFTFIEETYALVKLQGAISVYRGYETAGLTAPYGMDHPSFIHGLVAGRRPGTPDGLWWSPARPSKSIDNLGLSAMHRAEDRANSAVKLEWNRLDYYLEGELPLGAMVYVGRAAPQQDSALYGGQSYGGGAFQFRLTEPPERAFRWLKRYAAS